MNARAFATNAFKIGVITAAVGMFFPSCSLLWSRHKGDPVTQNRAAASLPHTAAGSYASSPHLAGDRPAPQISGSSATIEPQPQANPSNITVDRPLPIQGKISYPVAKTVPGRDGFVFSPFDQQRVIDVTEFKSGALVADPTYPLSDKKFFRVP